MKEIKYNGYNRYEMPNDFNEKYNNYRNSLKVINQLNKALI